MAATSDSQCGEIALLPDMQDLPHLRIVHFLLWTAIAAATLAFVNFSKLQDSPIGSIGAGIELFRLLVLSLPLTTLLLLIAWRWDGRQFALEPGHYLVAIGAIQYVKAMIHLAAYYDMVGQTMIRSERTYFEYFLGISDIGGWFLILGLLLRAWNYSKHQRIWMAYFAVALVAHLLHGIAYGSGSLWMRLLSPESFDFVLVHLYQIVTELPSLFGSALLTIILIVDWRDSKRRHWSHWAGFAYTYVLALFILVLAAISYLSR